jgi:hypothetical protein
MNRDEVVNTLLDRASIEPGFTNLGMVLYFSAQFPLHENKAYYCLLFWHLHSHSLFQRVIIGSWWVEEELDFVIILVFVFDVS